MNKRKIFILIVLFLIIYFLNKTAIFAADNSSQSKQDNYSILIDLLKTLFSGVPSLSGPANILYSAPTIYLTNYPKDLVSISPSIKNPAIYTSSNLVAQIWQHCQSNGIWGIVDKSNYQCTYLVNPALDQTALEILHSTVLYCCYWLQCTGFVRTIVYLDRNWVLDRRTQAKLFAYDPPSGYRLINRSDPEAVLKEGDLAVWDSSIPGGAGHIAYINKVYDEFNFRIAEANFTSHGQVGERNVNIYSPRLIGWLTPI